MKRTISGWALSLALLLPGLAVGAQGDLLARADADWARRAEGQVDYRAAPGPIANAIEGYESALRAQPANLEARWKLLRAIQFMGQFVAKEREQRREVFGHGRQVFEVGQDVLGERVGGREELDDMKPAELREHFGNSPDVAPVYLYGAINYGQWASAFGAVAALRQGVGARVRRYAEIVIALDPEYDGGAGQRFLAGIHSNAPRIPFLTGWVKRETAISLLRQALEIDPDHPETRMNLALTILRHAPDQESEAVAILAELAELEPRPDALLESLSMRRNAREVLERASAGSDLKGVGAGDSR